MSQPEEGAEYEGISDVARLLQDTFILKDKNK